MGVYKQSTPIELNQRNQPNANRTLTLPLYESHLKDYNIMVYPNSENLAGGEAWAFYM
jgi:hypothetical protein